MHCTLETSVFSRFVLAQVRVISHIIQPGLRLYLLVPPECHVNSTSGVVYLTIRKKRVLLREYL